MEKKLRFFCQLCVLITFSIASTLFAHQTTADPVLAKEIEQIKIIDVHCHIIQLPYKKIPKNIIGTRPFKFPVQYRLDHPKWIEAWRYLWGYKYDDMKLEHLEEAIKEKQRIRREMGDDYPSWILDKMGVETALVNLPKMGSGQDPPRFYQYPMVDPFLNPFIVINTNRFNPNKNYLFEKKGIKPSTSLNEYTTEIVTPTLESFKKKDLVAIKFKTALYRPLDIKKVSKKEASDVYEKLLKNKNIPLNEQRKLEDYLFRYICKEAGRVGLPVAIHTGTGPDPYFNITGSNPLLLESVLDDPEQKNTVFVLVHGGWPFDREAGSMLLRPNVYLDFSDTTFLRSTRSVSRVLRSWMEWMPEKIMFGSDAPPVPKNPLADWEETLCRTVKSGREALAIALTEMIEDDQITSDRAIELARMVLRENAIKVYKLEKLK